MSLHETIETFRNGLMWIGLWALAAITAGCAFAFLRRAVRSAAAWVWRSRMWFERFAFIGLFSVSLLFGGGKTNFPPLLMMPFPPSLQQTAVPSVTQEEIAQGWRFVGETNCAAEVYTMPDGFSPTFTWHRRGTFGEWARLDLGDFAFPLGTNDEAVTSFSVFNDGKIRPTPRDAAREICAVGVPMLAMQGASRFWVAETAAGAGRPPYRAKRLTWENFFLNADTNSPVNAQIELFQNGDFTTRSNDVERIYRRVAYFDWDGDGLENTVDPDPLVAGPDAHGTNAEWYNAVCSNVLEAVAATSAALPPELSWREGENSNAVHRGESGGIGMELRMYVTPLDVSFSEISVQEVPCSTYTVEGFFKNPYFNGAFTHSGGQFGVGAGHWIDVKPDDNMLDGFDTAAYETKIPWLTPSGMPTTNSAYAWTEGHAYMGTPLGWNVKGTRGDTPPYKRFGEDLQQVFRIDSHGRVGVFKLDNWVIRTTNDVVTLRGPITVELP